MRVGIVTADQTTIMRYRTAYVAEEATDSSLPAAEIEDSIPLPF